MSTNSESIFGSAPRWQNNTSDLVIGIAKERAAPLRIRYAVCRGLLFCPEKSMYYDLDGASAQAIAGLRVLKLKGFWA